MNPRTLAPAPAPAATRNRFLDAFRTVALVRILVWHAYGSAWLSYLIASMPAMFFVAGSLMAQSLSRGNSLNVLYRRFRRLLIPFWVFGILALLLMSVQAGGAAQHGIHLLWWVVPIWDPVGTEWGLTLTAPLWYLRCLTWLTILSPLLLWLWRKTGPALLLVPLGGLVLIESGRSGVDVPWQFADFSLFSLFWILGFAYHDGLFARVSSLSKAAMAGVTALAAVAWLLTQDVPQSIVNLSYPLHLFVGLAWLLLALSLENPINRLLTGGRAVTAITWINDRALTIYLWQTAGLLTMYQLLWSSEHAPWVRTLFALPIVLSVTFLGTLLFGWVEAFAGRRSRIRLPALRAPVFSPRAAATAAVGAMGALAIVVALAGVAQDPSSLVQATAHTVPPSGAGLHYRAQTAEIIPGPPIRMVTGRTDPVSSDELQAELQAWIEQWNLKGATVSIRRESGETWTGAAGFDDQDEPFYPDEPYWIASVTKTFTAALILRLSDEGALNLDDPAARFVPEFPNSDRFTIRQLLQHTSGLTSESEEPYKALAEAAKEGLQFEPGTGYLYSRAGYYLLGLIIENILGTSYTSALHAQILDPLDLTSTRMDEELDAQTGSTHPYYAENVVDEGEESWTQSRVFLEDTAGDWDYYGVLWSAGGLWSTTDDLTRWALALYDSDQVLSPPSLQEMTTFLGAQYDYTGLGTYPFCACWWNNGSLQSERWGFAGTTGILEFDPEDRIAIAVHMNGTLFDENVIDALEDFSARVRLLVRGREIAVEQMQEIPALQVYWVEDGDTLYDIADRLGIPAEDQERWVTDVMSLNEIDDGTSVEAGAELRIP